MQEPTYQPRDSEVRFVPLPPELWLWSGGDGSCRCGKCGGTAWWDTLAVPPPSGALANDGGRWAKDRTYLVHYPELHGSSEAYQSRGKQAETQEQYLERHGMKGGRL